MQVILEHEVIDFVFGVVENMIWIADTARYVFHVENGLFMRRRGSANIALIVRSARLFS